MKLVCFKNDIRIMNGILESNKIRALRRYI